MSTWCSIVGAVSQVAASAARCTDCTQAAYRGQQPGITICCRAVRSLSCDLRKMDVDKREWDLIQPDLSRVRSSRSGFLRDLEKLIRTFGLPMLESSVFEKWFQNFEQARRARSSLTFSEWCKQKVDQPSTPLASELCHVVAAMCARKGTDR